MFNIPTFQIQTSVTIIALPNLGRGAFNLIRLYISIEHNMY